MTRTKLSRRLADAYGVSLPTVTVPVADYWAVSLGAGGGSVKHYHGSDFLEEVVSADLADLVAVGTLRPQEGFFDASTNVAHVIYLHQTKGLAIARVDLAQDSWQLWYPQDHLPDGTSVTYWINRLVRHGGSGYALVATEPTSSSLDIRYSLVKWAVQGTFAPGVVNEIVRPWAVTSTPLHIFEGDIWLTGHHPQPGRLNAIYKERYGGSGGYEETLYLRLAEGEAIEAPSVTGIGKLHRTAGIAHPTNPLLSLMSAVGIGGALNSRGVGDVAPQVLWPHEDPWPTTRTGNQYNYVTTKSSEAVVRIVGSPARWARGPIAGPFGDAPTEIVEINADIVGQL